MIKILDAENVRAYADGRKSPVQAVEGVVSAIIAKVRQEGDAALLRYTKEFDGASLDSVEISRDEIEEAYASVAPEFIRVLEKAAANIRVFHEKQIRQGFQFDARPGVVLGQKILPIERVGLYIPGGTAAYPSSVLMNAIPAKLAGVGKLVMVTPPTGGRVNPVILAAAKIAGVDDVYAIGGAQAIAALAYGTRTVVRVDKIVGPGNAYVSEAKRQVFGTVAIDMIAGPSEILIIADEACDPSIIAADMLSQAEHDKNASAWLITASKMLADEVALELERQIPLLPRAGIARASIEQNGAIFLAGSLADAMDASNTLAPEHLELCVEDPFALLDSVRHAGSVFLGRSCPEALGDYMAGPNHTLPTSGAARFSSPLSVDDFIKKTQYISYSAEALEEDAADIAYFAMKEGLAAHARSVTARFTKADSAKEGGVL